MAKIEKLTPEQEAELPFFRQKYLDIATSGDRIDRPVLEAAMADAYAVIDKPAPKLFIFDSPAECLLAIKIFQMGNDKSLRDNLGDNLSANLSANLVDNLSANLVDNLRDNLVNNLRDNLRDNLVNNLGDNLVNNLGNNLRDNLVDNLSANLVDNLRDNLRDNLVNNLGDNLWDNLVNNLWANLRTNLRDNLWANLGNNLWANLRDNLRTNLGNNLGDNLWDNLGATNIWNPNFLWGSQDLYWIAYYRFAQKVGCVFAENDAKRLGIMEDISTQCEWWWPFDGVVFASQRPKVHWDGEGRMHREDGLAVEYKGGYGLAFWRGVCIPQEWISGGPPEADKIMAIPNTEQRRVACEMRGWQNVIPTLPDAKLIDKNPNPQIGELWQANLPDHGRECFLIVKCGTGRTFGMPVGPTFRTAREANAATYGIAPQLLDNLQFRT